MHGASREKVKGGMELSSEVLKQTRKLAVGEQPGFVITVQIIN